MNQKKRQNGMLVSALLDWFAQNARDLPWRRTQDPYAIWVSEIMLQQTQVKTVLPFWERWMRELPTIEAVAKASPDKIHKLWEGLGYYTRVRNLQKAAQIILKEREGEFPKTFDEVLALPGIGRYTAGAICSIAFNQPMPILDGNVVRVLTRVFGIAQDPREKETNELLWGLAEELVNGANRSCSLLPSPQHTVFPQKPSPGLRPPSPAPAGEGLARRGGMLNCCSHLNQSLMELGALVCAPRNPQCLICPVKKLCVAFKENRTEELPNLGKRAAATARRFVAFVVEHRGKFLVRQRPEKVVNAHMWEFPNVEANGNATSAAELFKTHFGFLPAELLPLPVVKHSITRYRITLEAFRVSLEKPLKKPHARVMGTWLSHAKFDTVAFTAAHKKLANFEVNRMMSGR
ncbi:MAG TPA: A/G-specific adenine glycosylase [Candidatus Acidoferrales bacterium]|nr:A/G-specific adenine glycosylase [Candidatus Acidoferrales bacterium]